MVIYCIINKLNGKLYVGKTVNFIKRMNSYRTNHHKAQPHLFNATTKYGWDNFLIEKLEENIELESVLNERERFWIRHLCSVEFGYNCTYGGEGQIPSEEVREKIRLSKLGDRNPMKNEETRKKVSESNKGRISPRRGAIMSDSSKNKVSEGLKRYYKDYKKIWDEDSKRKASKNCKHKKRIICIETGIIYNSIKEAGALLGLHDRLISKCVNGKRKRTGGLTFAPYKDQSE